MLVCVVCSSLTCAAAGVMSEKSVTELVGTLRRPFEDGHVWLATRGPGEFVGTASAMLNACFKPSSHLSLFMQLVANCLLLF